MRSLLLEAAETVLACAKRHTDGSVRLSDGAVLDDLRVAVTNASKRRDRGLCELEEALEACHKLLADIRYQTWPTKGLGIGLTAESLDEVLAQVDRLLPVAKGYRGKS